MKYCRHCREVCIALKHNLGDWWCWARKTLIENILIDKISPPPGAKFPWAGGC